MKRLLFAVLVTFAALSHADGPGSRIRAGPELQQPPNRAAARDLDRCDTLRDEEKERCKKAVRAAAAADEKPRGPEATGMGSGAGASAGTGTSGGGSFGSASPR
jgi:hypothetical protein